ncbi:hypothetical protein CspHIS471_0410200 [Cutaneotrichosporon sp. HIS471]|nr:hypothetical protein CspHIS471_0410200 [Cutaneotrichosporon sp. HIS471]
MSVLLETSLGEMVIDLEVDRCPRTCDNFLKLCKLKYYALNAFFNVSKDFIAQTGDPTATGTGGECVDALLYSKNPTGSQPARYFAPEITTKLKHKAKGTVSMAVAPTDPPGCGSQFFITLADNIDYLDGKHAVFGHVVEGLETLDKINDAYLDKEGRPLQDIRIRHVEILEDPFEDPPNMIPVPDSPLRPPDGMVRIADDEDALAQVDEDATAERARATAASSSALTLEMIGDLPFAAVRPPENILFVCKLNPVTQDEDLELIFSRFGKILSCEIVRDKKTGDSLQYAFIEYDVQDSAEQAYFKMQNVLVDDRRIWVDFSQSVAKMKGAYRPGYDVVVDAPRQRSLSPRWDRDDRRERDRPDGRDRRDDRRDRRDDRDDRRDRDSERRDRNRDDRDRDRDYRDRDRERDRRDRDRDRDRDRRR